MYPWVPLSIASFFSHTCFAFCPRGGTEPRTVPIDRIHSLLFSRAFPGSEKADFGKVSRAALLLNSIRTPNPILHLFHAALYSSTRAFVLVSFPMLFVARLLRALFFSRWWQSRQNELSPSSVYLLSKFLSSETRCTADVFRCCTRNRSSDNLTLPPAPIAPRRVKKKTRFCDPNAADRTPFLDRGHNIL